MNNSKCMHNINRYKLGRHNVKGLDIVPLQKLISAINITYFLKQIQFHLNLQKTRLSIYLTTEKIISFMTKVQYPYQKPTIMSGIRIKKHNFQ